MDKNIIIAISPEQGSGGGCWYHRIATIANHINASQKYGTKVIETPVPIFDGNLLAQTKCVLFQRPCGQPMLDWIKRYKELQPKFGYKLVGEFDDLVFLTGDADEVNDSVPPYNPSHDAVHKGLNEIMDIASKTLPLLDLIVVSTFIHFLGQTSAHLPHFVHFS